MRTISKKIISIIIIALLITLALSSCNSTYHKENTSDEMKKLAASCADVIENYLNGYVSASKAASILQVRAKTADDIVEKNKSNSDNSYSYDSSIQADILLAGYCMKDIAHELSHPGYYNIKEKENTLKDYLKALNEVSK